MVPVYYKGKRFPFNLNLPWLKVVFQEGGSPVMVEDADAQRLVKEYPGSFYTGTVEVQVPDEKPAEPEPEPDGRFIRKPRFSHLVMDFKNMRQSQLCAFVVRFWGEYLPNNISKQQIFNWVMGKLENMAEEDMPTIVNHHVYQLLYLERKQKESGRPIIETPKS